MNANNGLAFIRLNSPADCIFNLGCCADGAKIVAVRYAYCFLSALLMTSGFAGGARAQDRSYHVYVASEAADKITLIRFSGGTAVVDHEISTGLMPVDIDGPHGLVISPDQKFYYVSMAHGQPNGAVWKYSTKDDTLLGRVTLGMFPATMDLTPDGDFLYVVNFNLHGDPVPSTVSVVTTEDMVEIARIPTCTMPHGSRINAAGTRHYSVCMMDEQLVEIDTATLKTTRHFVVTKGRESGMAGPPMRMAAADRASHTAAGHGTEAPAPGDTTCAPTWVEPSPEGTSLFVACNGSSEIVEIDAKDWKLIRRIDARPGVYNLAISGDGRLIATNRRDQSVSVFDRKAGRELTRIVTKRKILHGVTISPDNRYAFISVEGVGSEPGTVEVLDLQSLRIAATVDVGQQAGGIDFLRMDSR